MITAIRSVYARLGQTLKAHGLTFANVVKENVYATDLGAFIENKALRMPFYVDAQPLFPAATWIQVPRLYTPSHVLEIELVAVFPQ